MADIYGKIIAVLPTRSGTSARGTQWSSQTAVIETQEQYPKKLAFDVINDKINQFNIQVGEFLTVQFDINAREYNGRWFNSVNAWNVIRQAQQAPVQGCGFSGNPQTGAQAAQQAAMAGAPNPMNTNNPFPPAQHPGAPAGQSDNLPF